MASKITTIIRGTTPTIQFLFSTLDVTEIEDAKLVIKQEKEPIIVKDFSDATVSEGCVEWTLTQEDTFKLIEFKSAEVYCDWKTSSGTRGRSKMTVCTVEPTGYEGIL